MTVSITAVYRAYRTPDATFSAQAKPIAGRETLASKTEQRGRVRSFHGTHTGPGGPVRATGRSISTDYVYVMQLAGDKISHMTKIWNAGLALKDLGWA